MSGIDRRKSLELAKKYILSSFELISIKFPIKRNSKLYFFLLFRYSTHAQFRMKWKRKCTNVILMRRELISKLEGISLICVEALKSICTYRLVFLSLFFHISTWRQNDVRTLKRRHCNVVCRLGFLYSKHFCQPFWSNFRFSNIYLRVTIVCFMGLICRALLIPIILISIIPNRKVAEKAVCRSVFLTRRHSILSAD